MTSLIVDASVALKWVVPEKGVSKAEALLRRPEDIIAPALVLAEAANALWKKRRVGALAVDPEDALREIVHAFVEFVPEELLAPRALSLAVILDHPVYDCFYLALAEARGGTLITADGKLIARLKQGDWQGRFEAL